MRSLTCALMLNALASLPCAAYGLEDPTRPVAARSALAGVASVGGATEVRLQAIINRSGDADDTSKAHALINNDIMQIGDRQRGFTLVKVLKDRVVIRRNGGQLSELLLNAEIKDKP
ncbi:MAG: hypothetical protein RIC89_09530 [Pseudomonadales bacterium]